MLVSVGCLLWCVGVGEMLGIGLVVFVGVLGREIWVVGRDYGGRGKEKEQKIRVT